MSKEYKNIKHAFTLAEVLITLGIIGVVAAMTIPNLITAQQKQTTAKKLAKVYSILYQGFLNAQTSMGESQSWDLPSVQYNSAVSDTWWNKYFIPYAKLSVAKSCTIENGIATSVCAPASTSWLDGTGSTAFSACDCGGCFILNDGTLLQFSGVSNGDAGVSVDTNGQAPPNTWGKDIFEIRIQYPTGHIVFYGYGASRDTLLSPAANACNKQAASNSGRTCGAVIEMDAWQIKDDYPW